MKGAMFYFSGTGNSRYIAEKFAQIMGYLYRQEFDVHSIEETNLQDALKENTTLAFCYPIYGSSVPRIMRRFVHENKGLLAGKKIIIFCTQLIFSGDGARAFAALIGDIPAEIILAEHFSMPNNICNFPLLRIEKGEAVRKHVAKAEKKLGRACQALSENRKSLRGFNTFSRLLGLLQRPAFRSIEKNAADKVAVDPGACTLCGRCVRECPMQNLHIQNNSIKGKGDCTLCYRCVNHCPQKAITVWLHSKVSRQYQGPEG